MLITFGLLNSVQFQSDPCFIRRYFPSILHCAGNLREKVSADCIQYLSKKTAYAMYEQERGRQIYAGGKTYHAGVRAKKFWHTIYCAKTRPNPGYQSCSQSSRVLGTQTMQITREYNLVTSIVIWTLTYPRTCERDSFDWPSIQ